MVGLHEKRLKIVFKQVYGKGLYTHLRELRLQKAKDLLMEGIAIKVIVREIGYKNGSQFSAGFTRWQGESPSSFRKNLLKAV
jgi:AraC-like DNA-binding protein